MNFRPNLSENEILIYNSVVGNRTILLSPNLQRNTDVHKSLTQICTCGTVLIVAVSASLTNDDNLSHFDFKSYIFSTTEVNSSHVIVQILYTCTFSWKSNEMGIFKEEFFYSLPVLHITFNGGLYPKGPNCAVPGGILRQSPKTPYLKV